MEIHHNPNSGEECLFCGGKLSQAHPEIVSWFHRAKAKFPNIHVSCSYRNALEQEKAFLAGATKRHYPNSLHNTTNYGLPCSLALDIFVLDEDGVGRWPFKYYQLIDEWNRANKEEIRWGGNFTDIKDGPHFELTMKVVLVSNGAKGA